MRRFVIISILFFIVSTALSAHSLRPVSHQVRYVEGEFLNASKGVVLLDMTGTSRQNIDFLPLKRKGVPMTVDCGLQFSEKFGVRQISGAYNVTISEDSIAVIGYDERGLFYGLRTLRHIVEMSDLKNIPCCQINDWPDREYRGFTDGSSIGERTHESMLAMIELAGNLNMTEFVYAPQDDPYAGSPDWYLSYSQVRADMLEELMEACRKHHMEFTWCIRPDNKFSWSEEDYALLLGKLEMMHYIGVRSFGVLFQEKDERVDALIERLDKDFVSQKKDVKPLLTSLDGYYAPKDGGTAMKLGLYGVGLRGWNAEDYDPIKCLEQAANAIAPEVADAYMTYVLHSDISAAFGIEESSDLDLIGLKDYGKGEYDRLLDEFTAIENVPEIIAGIKDNQIYKDLKPWLDEFGKLGKRCRLLLESIDLYNRGDIPGFWTRYASNYMSERDMEAYMAYPSGASRLQPYYETMMDALVDAFYHTYKDKVEYEHISGDGAEIYIAPDEAAYCHLILDNPREKEVIVRLSDASGKYTAEFCIESSYLEFELKDDAVKVEVIGDVDVFETVFVK